MFVQYGVGLVLGSIVTVEFGVEVGVGVITGRVGVG